MAFSDIKIDVDIINTDNIYLKCITCNNYDLFSEKEIKEMTYEGKIKYICNNCMIEEMIKNEDMENKKKEGEIYCCYYLFRKF